MSLKSGTPINPPGKRANMFIPHVIKISLLTEGRANMLWDHFERFRVPKLWAPVLECGPCVWVDLALFPGGPGA